MIKTIYDADFKDKRVLLSVDFNVPIDEKGEILDDMRIREALTTIQYLLASGCRQLVIMSHLGRPDGKVVDILKMDRVAARLMHLLGKDVLKLDDCINIHAPEDKRIVLLENVRFHKEEEKNGPEFAKKLAMHGDIYVNDAFGTAHREHASNSAVTKFLPGYIGALIMKEIKALSFENPEHPFVAIIGGAKLGTKIPIINNLMQKVDKMLVGGAMIFTFYNSMGYTIGNSMFDPDYMMMAKMMLNNEKLLLPTDIVVADSKEVGTSVRTVKADSIPAGAIGLDIGMDSVAMFKTILKDAKTVVWNGPLGYTEVKDFAKATEEIAGFLAVLDAKVVIGGGDTAEIINRLGMAKRFYHVSTGGGASMAFLEGKKLPALKALEEQNP